MHYLSGNRSPRLTYRPEWQALQHQFAKGTAVKCYLGYTCIYNCADIYRAFKCTAVDGDTAGIASTAGSEHRAKIEFDIAAAAVRLADNYTATAFNVKGSLAFDDSLRRCRIDQRK